MAATIAVNLPAKTLKTVLEFLNVRPGDGLPLAILLGHSFLKGVGRVFFDVPVNSLFLNKFSIGSLPAVYIGTAVVSTILGLGYAKLEEKSSARSLLTYTLIFLAAATGLLYIALLLTDSPMLAMGAMIWKDVNWMLMSVEFWALAGLLLDVRQGKRLFGLITAGEIVAGMVSGLSVPLVVRLGGTLSLLLVSFAALALNVAFLIYTFRLFGDRDINFEEAEKEEPEKRQSLPSMFKDRYLVMFFAVSVLSFLAEYFIEYVFYGQVESAFPSEARMASFFGLFYGLTGAAQLATSASAGALLTRYGMGLGLMLLPVANLATSGLAAAAGSFRTLAVLVFGAVMVTKLMDEVVRHTVEMPVYTLLYQPLPRSGRLRAQAVRESIVEPVAIGFCGVFLYVFRSILHLTGPGVLYVTFGVCAAWAAIGFLLQREYIVRLTRALTTGRLSGGSLSLQDPFVMLSLRKGLSSPKAGQVIYSLTMLDQGKPGITEQDLIRLLDHADPMVRRHVLERIEGLSSGDALAAVMNRLAVEEDLAIKGCLLHAVCAIGEEGTLELVTPFLADPSPEVREGALSGILRYCGLDGALGGGPQLNSMLNSTDPAERILGARVLGDIGISSYYRPLLPLLADKDNRVRRAAVDSVRRLGCKQALPQLMEALASPAIRDITFQALASFGDAALPFIEKTLNDAGQARHIQAFMARLAGKIGSRECADALKKHVHDADCTVRTQVFASLASVAAAKHSLDAATVRTLVEREISDAVWVLAVMLDIPEESASSSVRRALHYELDERKKRIFLLLSSIHPRRVIEKARQDLMSGVRERRTNAMEVLDNILPREIKVILLPLLDDISDRDRLERLRFRFPQKRLAARARIEEIIGHPPGQLLGWTRACAVFMASYDPSGGWTQIFESAAADPEPIVTETAVWALSKSAPFGERATFATHN